jgi:hypothetical protein
MKFMKARYGLLLIPVALLIVAIAFAGGNANTGEFNKTIEVYGNGYAALPPDEARIIVAVQTEAKTAKEAAEQNAKKMTAVHDALANLVGEENIKTLSYSIQPVYEWDEKGRKSVIVGYRALNRIEVKCSPTMAGDVVDTAVARGANKIDSISFGLSEEARNEAYDEALKNAVRDAKDKAKIVAEELEIGYYQPVKVEVGYQPVYPVYRAYAEKAETPISPPTEIEVSASVKIIFGFQ